MVISVSVAEIVLIIALVANEIRISCETVVFVCILKAVIIKVSLPSSPQSQYMQCVHSISTATIHCESCGYRHCQFCIDFVMSI